MARYGDARQQEMYEQVKAWVSAWGLQLVCKTLLGILADLFYE